MSWRTGALGSEFPDRSVDPEQLKREARTAISWGRPDQESIGYDPDEFIGIISRLLAYIERLERR